MLCITRRLIACALLSSAAAANGATAVGRIEGTFSVSDTGAAIYSVPIKVTPGIAGMSPNLALTYSSDDGDGFAGVGWSLSGLSTITRCASTIAQDGAVRGVFFDEGDKFCLDGQKLRLAAGSYGASGSQYRTEIDSFMRIVAYSSGGSGAAPSVGPQWFSATTKDGTVIQYGATDNSRIEAQGKTVVRAWAINRITDVHGNFIEFQYSEDSANGAYVPTSINYTGHPGQATRYSVRFDYEPRPAGDIDTAYISGSLIKQINRLAAIRLQLDGIEISSYALTYQSATASVTGSSRLDSLTYCAGGDCFPATTFGWSDGQTGWGNLVPSAAYPVDPLTPFPALALDVNGDGREDIAYPANNVWTVRFGRTDGTFDAPKTSSMSATNHSYAMVIDYDGDGLMDVLQPDGNPGNWQVLRWNGSALQLTNTGIPALGVLGAHFTADINGDGLYDVIWIVPKSVTGSDDELHIRVNSPSGFGADELLATFSGTGVRPFGAESSYFRSTVRRAEINGDGQTDFFVFYSSTGHVCDPELGCFPVTSNVWQSFLSLRPAFPLAYPLGGISSSANPPVMMDMNGDGNTDGSLVWTLNNQNYLTTRISKGDHTYTETQRSFPYTSASNTSIADWDSDGRDDLLVPEINGSSQYELKVYRSNGSAYEGGLWTGTPWNTSHGLRRLLMDVNGDGFPDIVWHNGTTWETRLRLGAKPDLLTSVTDGFGNSTSIVHAPLTASDVYTKATGAAKPIVRDYQGPRYVVKSATTNDGIGGTYTVSYAYSGAKVHTQGRGFLGFESITATDSRNGVAVTESFYQDFPYIGMLREQRIKTGATTLALASSTPNKRMFGTGYESWVFPYVETSTSEQREVGGGLVRTITSTSAFDDYGNLTDLTESVSDIVGNTFTTDIHRNYSNDTTNWCLGRWTLESVTKTLPDGSFQTRSKTAVPDPAVCRIASVTEEPGPRQTKTEFGYDAWGNRKTITVRGAGMASRQSSCTFGSDGYFPRVCVNAKDHQTLTTWNYKFGSPASHRDANSLTTSWQYDGFGRPTLETRPDSTGTQWVRDYCSLGCGVGNGHYQITTLLKNVTTAEVGGTQYSVFDALDRPVRESRILLAGRESHVQTQYDALGRIFRRSAPYYSGRTPFWSTFSYDILNRVSVEDHPQSESQPTGRLVTYSYNGLITSVTDPLSHSTTRYENARGEVVQVTDARGSDTLYTYWPFGELKTVEDHLGNQKAMTYDVRGRKASMSDPDMGSWVYNHNALGELITQTDANQLTVTLGYDELGRLKTRQEPEGTTAWDYDSAPGRGIGRIAAKSLAVGSSVLYSDNFRYDDFGRLAGTTSVMDGMSYDVATTYDTLGRVATVQYPDTGLEARFTVRHDYDPSSGILQKVYNDATPSLVYWTANSANAWGQITEEQAGNGLVTTRRFDLARGLIERVTAGAGTIQDLAYDWDLAGNLEERTDRRQDLTETFKYDELNRMYTARVAGGSTLSVTYDAIGNIETKSDVGTYIYGSSRPHAVTSVQGVRPNSFSYDDNGNMVTGSGRTVTWSSFNYPLFVDDGDDTSTFEYGPDRNRYKHVRTAHVPDEVPQASFTASCSELTCSVDASASSDDHGITSYTWSFGDGQSGSGISASHTYGTGGSYTIVLTVTDSAGQTGTDSEMVLADGPPVASYTYSCTVLSCNFDGSASFDESGISSYSWAFGDGGAGSGAQVSYTYAAGGLYTVTLTVADTTGHVRSISRDIGVDAPPVADFSFYCASGNCSFDASTSSDDQGISSYTWSFGDGAIGSGVTASHTYSAPGVYTVTLTVTDTTNQTASVSKPVDPLIPVDNPPTPNFSYSCSNLACEFNASASSDDHGIISYHWYFGDGAEAANVVATSHTYGYGGAYTVRLRVVDTVGQASVLERTVRISAGLLDPVCVILQPGCSSLPGEVGVAEPINKTHTVDGITAPDFDIDGTFAVTWSDHACDGTSLIENWNETCEARNQRYVLEVSTQPNFGNAAVVYDGPATSYTFSSLVPGRYYFRMKEYYEICTLPRILSGGNECDPNDDGGAGWDPGSTRYYQDTLGTDVGPYPLQLTLSSNGNSDAVTVESDESDPEGAATAPQQTSVTSGGTYTTTTTHYVGRLYERREVNGVVEHVHYIRAANAAVAIYTARQDGARSTNYVFRDHLGSLDVLTDDGEAGAVSVIERFSYDAFGKRRNPTTWAADEADDLLRGDHAFHRGFTFHEHLDHVELIHMNGRVYDPIIGRMASADPTVPGVWNGQAHNRYSYVVNNPLTLVDPSGFGPCTVESCDTIPVNDPYPQEPIGYDSYDAGPGGFRRGDAASIGNLGGLLNLARLATRSAASRQNNQLREWNKFSKIRNGRDEYGIGSFIQEEGLNVLYRTATTVGGGGQVLLGGALCSTALGCVAGGPLAALGASNIQEGLSGEPGFFRSAATSFFGDAAGNLAVDAANIVSSGAGLIHPVLKPDAWKLFNYVGSDFVPAYVTATRTGLRAEVGAGALGVTETLGRYYGP